LASLNQEVGHNCVLGQNIPAQNTMTNSPAIEASFAILSLIDIGFFI
jgi:hypothetical protein